MKLYPVVHMYSEGQALQLTEQALGAGADGVFLIDHLTDDPNTLTGAYEHVRRAVGSEAFIGVNYLSLTPSMTIEWLKNTVTTDLPDALWCDDAVSRRGKHNVLRLKQESGVPADKLRYFGGIAFKYTPSYTDSPDQAAVLAASYRQLVDVVTTSGPGTGKAVDAAKVRAMKEVIDGQELALASGVDIDNIASYKPYVDSALVASSVETRSYSGEYDLPKLYDLVQAAHE